MTSIIEIIGNVTREVGGMEATKKGAGVPFAYRGVEDVVGHLKAKLDEAGVIYVPTIIDRVTSTREIAGGKAITQSDLTVKYTFYSPDASDTLETIVPGLAQDFSDRSAAQAMSVALRIALIQIFKLQAGDTDPEEAAAKTQAELEKTVAEAPKAKGATAKAAPAEGIKEVRDKLQRVIADTETYEAYTAEVVNGLGSRHSKGKSPEEWFGDLKVLNAIVASIKAGEIE
jgi:hypothetical protein